MARYVADDAVDAGLTGQDWIAEHYAATGSTSGHDRRPDLLEAELSQGPVGAGRARRLGVSKPQDLEGARISTELVRATESYFARLNVKVHVEFSWGATEVKRPVWQMPSSRQPRRARPSVPTICGFIDTVLESNPQLVASQKAVDDPWKKEKLDNIALLLKAAIEAQGRVGLMLNVERTNLDELLGLLPALQKPTVAPLSDANWVAVTSILEERAVRELIPRLKAVGGTGSSSIHSTRSCCNAKGRTER